MCEPGKPCPEVEAQAKAQAEQETKPEQACLNCGKTEGMLVSASTVATSGYTPCLITACIDCRCWVRLAELPPRKFDADNPASLREWPHDVCFVAGEVWESAARAVRRRARDQAVEELTGKLQEALSSLFKKPPGEAGPSAEAKTQDAP